MKRQVQFLIQFEYYHFFYKVPKQRLLNIKRDTDRNNRVKYQFFKTLFF